MSDLNPIKIKGLWDEGYAIDYHTISSTPVGVDFRGNTVFDTKRTDLGELVYQYKYHGSHECLDNIIRIIEPIIVEWLSPKGITVVLPVPPTKKDRSYQPVFEIAKRVANILDSKYNDTVLRKDSTEQSKNISIADKEAISGSIIKTKMALRKHNILIVDDLYQSGATLNGCTHALRQDENIHKIYVLTITRTKG